jgi:hypothetical protein
VKSSPIAKGENSGDGERVFIVWEVSCWSLGEVSMYCMFTFTFWWGLEGYIFCHI